MTPPAATGRLAITDLEIGFGGRQVVSIGELALGHAEILGLAGESGSGIFGYIGLRATGGGAGQYLIAGPGWTGDTPAGAKRIDSPMPWSFWVIGRRLNSMARRTCPTSPPSSVNIRSR